MKRYNSTLIKMTRRLGMAIAALLMLSTMASCSDQDSQAPATGDEAYLNLSFSTASNTTSRASRAGDIGKDDETQANPNTESDIHSIKVWVFKSGTGEKANPIAYKEDRPTAVGGGTANGTYTLNLRFLRKINGEELEKIDLYILANSESTNMAKKLENKDFRSITRADLQKVTFDTPFGIIEEGKAETTEVPTEGLPISRAITNIAIAKHVADTEIEAKSKGINIPLVRAVSKLHFYFARKAGDEAMTGNVKVTRIEIDKNTFPTASYVFPDEEDYATADANKAATSKKYGTPTYVDKLLTLDGVENTGIKEVEDPTAFIKKDSQTAQEYLKAFKDSCIDSHHLSYLRDTNKPITGRIYYQLAEGGSEKFREFTIPSEDKAIRNRELVVYGYFLQGGALCLDLQPIVSDWVDNIAWEYTDTVSIEMVRDEGEYRDAVEVHYGIRNGGGPAITLKNIDTGDKNWILQCDNPDFEFYVDGKKYDTVSKSDISGTSFTFYVVPKRNKDLAVERNFNTNVFIVLAPDMRKVLFNVGDGKLPGDGFNIKFTQGADRSGI